MLWLFAQSAESIPVWAQIAGGIATAGFTAWYAWYTTTKTIPDLNDKHSAIIEKLVNEFRADSKEQRDAERQRAITSTELARSGHAAMTQVTRAVDDLRDAINRHGFDTREAGA